MKLIDMECPTCKKIFHPRYNGRKFCSAKCIRWEVGRKKTKFAKKNKCDQCGKIFEGYRNKEKKFCSTDCSILGQTKRKKTYLICKQCGKKFYSGHLNSKFCSQQCHFKFCKRENHPSWQGGKSSDYDIFKISKEWKTWRKKIFERDNYTCQGCGHKSGKGIKRIDIHPHHIKSASKFPELRIEINNGITLCASCHGKKHSINFKNRRKKL